MPMAWWLNKGDSRWEEGGDLEGFHPNGKPYFEYYRDNLLVKGMSIDANGRDIYDQSSFFPNPQAGIDAYEKYLSRKSSQ